MNGFFRILAGVAGGFAASASKILALDVEKLGYFMTVGNLDEFHELKVTIYIFTPILMILGGIIAWASQENNRMKAMAIGCAAPALIAPWTSGQLTTSNQRSGLIAEAYAQQTVEIAQNRQNNYVAGVKGLLGIESPEDRKYWVIVGSERDLQSARDYAKQINQMEPKLKAFVGQKQPDNEFYPIIVGGEDAYLEYRDAEKLKQEAMKLSIIPSSTYLSDYEKRLPAVR